MLAQKNQNLIAQYTIKNLIKKTKKKSIIISHHITDDQGRDYYDGHSHNNDHAK